MYREVQQVLIDEAATPPLVDELAVWAFRANAPGTKYNVNADPALSDVTIKK